MKNKLMESIMDKDYERLTLWNTFKLVNEGFWEGFTEGLKELPVYYAVTVPAASVILWLMFRKMDKEDNKD